MFTKCGHCGGSMWELNEELPAGARFKVFFVRCSKCKVPVGVLPYYDLHTKISNVEKKSEIQLSAIQRTLSIIDENIRRLFLK